MLQPARRKYRKEQKGRNKGIATRGTSVSFGDFGLKATGRGRLTARQIEAARRAMTRHIKRGGRVWIRIHEVEQSCSLITQMLNGLPGGPVLASFDPAGRSCEGLGLVEGFRGDILVWLALDDAGRIRRCHLRDPSWFQWPLLEAAIEGNIIADFPLCNKSFNCSYSGHDL